MICKITFTTPLGHLESKVTKTHKNFTKVIFPKVIFFPWREIVKTTTQKKILTQHCLHLPSPCHHHFKYSLWEQYDMIYIVYSLYHRGTPCLSGSRWAWLGASTTTMTNIDLQIIGTPPRHQLNANSWVPNINYILQLGLWKTVAALRCCFLQCRGESLPTHNIKNKILLKY